MDKNHEIYVDLKRKPKEMKKTALIALLFLFFFLVSVNLYSEKTIELNRKPDDDNYAKIHPGHSYCRR